MNTLQDYVNKLESLGSADQAALFFEQEGIKGHLGAAFHCPIANYLARETKLSVGVCTIDIFDETNQVTIDLPPMLHQFVLNFDEEKYPELVEP